MRARLSQINFVMPLNACDRDVKLAVQFLDFGSHFAPNARMVESIAYTFTEAWTS